jgi:hypothetical protein
MRTTINSAAIRDTTRAIADLFHAASVDEVVSHDQIKALIPAGLQHISHYIFAHRAFKLLNKEHGLVFATVPREGYRRMRHVTGAQYTVDKMLRRTRRVCRKGQTVATSAISFANDATPSERRQVYQGINLGGLLEHLATLRTAKSMPEEPPRPKPDNFSWLREMMGGPN